LGNLAKKIITQSYVKAKAEVEKRQAKSEGAKRLEEHRKIPIAKPIQSRPVSSSPSKASVPTPKTTPKPKPVGYVSPSVIVKKSYQEAKQQVEARTKTPEKKYYTKEEYHAEQVKASAAIAHQRQQVEKIQIRQPSLPYEHKQALMFGLYKKQLAAVEREQNKIRKQSAEGLTEWHPQFRAKKTNDGWQLRHPYAGAEEYGTYKEMIDPSQQKDIGGHAKAFYLNLATSFTGDDYLGVSSAVERASGRHQKALDIKIQATHSLKTKPFYETVINMPTTQIGLAAVGSGAISAISSRGAGVIAGAYGAGSKAMLAYQGSQAAVGGVFIGMGAYDVKSTFEREGLGKGIGKLTQFGFTMGAGAAGYKAGTSFKWKGATQFEYGYRKGFEKRIIRGIESGKISPTVGSEVIQANKLEFDLRRSLQGVKPVQPDIDVSKVGTLKGEPEMQDFFSKHLLRRKSEVFGSLSEGRDAVHDIDIMYRNLSQGIRETSYASRKLTGRFIKKFADIKPFKRVGSQVGRAGTIKQRPFIDTKGHHQTRWSESAMRHGESSLELQHAGRVKDIPRSVELYTKLFKSAGEPAHLRGTLSQYAEVMGRLEKSPLIMSPDESMFVYGGKSLVERWSGFKQKVRLKAMGESQYIGAEEMSFRKTMGMSQSDVLKNTKLTVGGQAPDSFLVERTGQKLYGQALPYDKKYQAFVTDEAIAGRDVFITTRHELQHILHPRAPEFSIGGVKIGKYKIFPGAEDIPHAELDLWAARAASSVYSLPSSPSPSYGFYMTASPSVLSSSSSSLFASIPSISMSSKKSYIKTPSITYKPNILKSSYNKRVINRRIINNVSSSKSIITKSKSIIKPNFKPKIPSGKSFIPKIVIPSPIIPSPSPKSPTSTVYSPPPPPPPYSPPPYSPSKSGYVPPYYGSKLTGLYGSGTSGWGERGLDPKYRFRKWKIKNPLSGGWFT